MLQVQGYHGSGDYNQQKSNDQENEHGTNMTFFLPGKPCKHGERQKTQKDYPENNKQGCEWPVLYFKEHACNKKY